MEIYVNGRLTQVHVERKRIRNMYLRVNPDCGLRISCAKSVSEARIRQFIESKESWIIKAQMCVKNKERVHQEGAESPVIWWLGEKKYVRYVEAARDRIIMEGDIMTFYLKDFSEERITKTFRKYASQQLLIMAEESRGQWDDAVCRKHRLPLPSIHTRYMTSRWGVCKPSEHKITLSIRLIHYPREAFESVLLHEYVHFLVQNHSSAFYAHVCRLMPQYDLWNGYLK